MKLVIGCEISSCFERFSLEFSVCFAGFVVQFSVPFVFCRCFIYSARLRK